MIDLASPDVVVSGREPASGFRWLNFLGGVYAIEDARSGEVLYVGSSRHVGRRIRQHRGASSRLFGHMAGDDLALRIRVWVLPCAALQDAECATIGALRPAMNKRPPFRCIEMDNYVTRRRTAREARRGRLTKGVK